MTQYDDSVERQRRLLLAEEWAKGVKSVHAHSLTSCWYDTRGNDGSVLDVEYNNGVVMREIKDTGEIIFFGEPLKGDELLSSFGRHTGK
jgi:hypothetical protein